MKNKHLTKKVDHVNLKILNELIIFCMSSGATDLDMKLKDEADRIVMSISTEAKDLPQKLIDQAKAYLKVPRQHELESYYWQLSGESDDEIELNLVGMMTDEAELIYDNPRLTINIIRKK